MLTDALVTSDGFRAILMKIAIAADSEDSVNLNDDNYAIKMAHRAGKRAALEEVLQWVAMRLEEHRARVSGQDFTSPPGA